MSAALSPQAAAASPVATGAAGLATHLELIAPVPLRLDLRGLLPLALAALDEAAIARLPLGLGRGTVAVGEVFRVRKAVAAEPTLRIAAAPGLGAGATARLDRLGWGLDGGVIELRGDAGDHLGSLMTAGRLTVRGSAGLQAGCQMAGGRLEVHGDVGDFAASGLPGSMDGMRGGEFIVHGRAGARLADRLRRGTLIVLGEVGEHAASRLVAGTVLLGGRVGPGLASGQRRGSVLLLDPGPGWQPPTTFVPEGAGAPVAWQLMARSLARQHGALSPRIAALPGLTPRRWLGDLAADGRGELILVPG